MLLTTVLLRVPPLTTAMVAPCTAAFARSGTTRLANARRQPNTTAESLRLITRHLFAQDVGDAGTIVGRRPLRRGLSTPHASAVPRDEWREFTRDFRVSGRSPAATARTRVDRNDAST